MKHKLYIFLLFFILHNGSFAQKLNLNQGNLNDDSKSKVIYPGLPEAAGKDAEWITYLRPSGFTLVIYEALDKKSRQAIVYGAKYLNGKFENAIALDTFQKKAIYYYYYRVSLSPDMKHFYLTVVEGSKSNKLKLKFFDLEFRPVHSNTIIMPTTPSAFLKADSYMQIDNNNNLFMLASLDPVWKKGSAELLIYNSTSRTVSKLPVPSVRSEMNFTSKAKLTSDEKGRMYIGGGYYAKDNGKADGIFLYEIDGSKKTFSKTLTYSFNEELSHLKNLSNYVELEKVCNLKNDNLLLLLRSSFTYIQIGAAGSLAITGISITPDGKMEYTFSLLKSESYTGKTNDYMGFLPIKTEASLYLIYNDLAENLQVTGLDKPKTQGLNPKLTSCVAQVNLETGKFTKSFLFEKSTEKNKPIVNFFTYDKIDANNYLIRCDYDEEGKSYRYLDVNAE